MDIILRRRSLAGRLRNMAGKLGEEQPASIGVLSVQIALQAMADEMEAVPAGTLACPLCLRRFAGPMAMNDRAGHLEAGECGDGRGSAWNAVLALLDAPG